VDLVDDGSLMIVGTAYDAARADSDVLAEMTASGVDLAQPLLLRHHLVVPSAAALEEAREVLGQEGYAVTAEPASPERPDARRVLAVRTQVLTVLSVAQQRSRVAGLAQRLGGDVSGWDALAARRPTAQ